MRIDHFVITDLFGIFVEKSFHARIMLDGGLSWIKVVLIIDHHNGSISIGGVDQFGGWQFFKCIVAKIMVAKFSFALF